MDDFKEQYRQELIYQEIKSNKHTLLGFVWFLAGMALIWLLTVIGFFAIDKSIVTIVFAATVILFLPPLYIFLKGR